MIFTIVGASIILAVYLWFETIDLRRRLYEAEQMLLMNERRLLVLEDFKKELER